MHTSSNKPVASSLRWIGCLHALPNVFWSLLCIAPVYLFCYQRMKRPWLYTFIGVSFIPYALPASWLRCFQLSLDTAVYRLLRVHLAGRVTQHGSFINTLVQRKYPRHRFTLDQTAITNLERTTYGRERFHLAMFFFFLLSAIYAAAAERATGWVLLLLLVNLIYNLYPIWLQQYIRIRLRRLSLRS